MTWTPTSTPHDRLCECGGEALIPIKVRDQRGDQYIAWRPCKGTGPWLPDRNPGREMSWEEYVERNPNWFTDCAVPDWRAHEFCRLTGKASARDKGCVPFPEHNPLWPLVREYATGFGWIDPATIEIEEPA